MAKDKKRKHFMAENSDNISSKNFVVDAVSENSNTLTKRVKLKKKPKKEENFEIEEKSNKLIAATNEIEEHTDDIGQELPSEVIEESKQLKVALSLETNRKKKKDKHKKLLEAKSQINISREMQRNEEYLRLWKYSREQWRFEKLRQIGIEQTLLNGLDSELWPIALEYLAGSKGAARDRLLKQANQVIEKIDQQCEKEETESGKMNLINSVAYQRARDLLQNF